MEKESRMFKEKSLNQITNQRQKMNIAHNSSQGNLKNFASRRYSTNQSQVDLKSSKTHLNSGSQNFRTNAVTYKKGDTEKENSQAVQHQNFVGGQSKQSMFLPVRK